ncbi:MAG: coproporphyrinogen dehydrogenase HemZ [Oscillospiraceae bacterium]
MIVYITGHGFVYELENIARLFAREVSVEQSAPPENMSGDCAYLWRTVNCEAAELGCSVIYGGSRCEKREAVSGKATDRECELMLSTMLFDTMRDMTGFCPPWGIITGIRPAKFAGAMLCEQSAQEVESKLESTYRVSEKKAELCVQTAINGEKIACLNTEKSYSLYVSIPFCPSKCSYCTFVSKSVEREKHLVQPYLDKLCIELEQSADIAKALGLKLESVYIGGGTPTVLSARQLKTLTDTISRCFPLEQAREYSVEAGRPDTITEQKLSVLKAAGVTRISINPQTSNERVLEAIGRKHTDSEIETSFELARRTGFDNINADLIAGLPCDDIESFKRSMQWLLGLHPENITVHALTLKRASKMTKNHDGASGDASEMVDYAYDKLTENGYSPYYMYKQKGTVDALENTGYARPGFECLYNVYIMDELHTIIACGAGAVTKLYNQKKGLINRIFNYKYPKEYIDGFDVILERRKGITDFYEI